MYISNTVCVYYSILKCSNEIKIKNKIPVEKIKFFIQCIKIIGTNKYRFFFWGVRGDKSGFEDIFALKKIQI